MCRWSNRNSFEVNLKRVQTIFKTTKDIVKNEENDNYRFQAKFGQQYCSYAQLPFFVLSVVVFSLVLLQVLFKLGRLLWSWFKQKLCCGIEMIVSDKNEKHEKNLD